MNLGATLVNLIIIALPLLLIVFLVVGQRRRQRAIERLQGSLTAGDQVVTTAGLHGRITTLDDTMVQLEVAPDVVLRFDRRAVGMKLTPSTSGNDAGE